MLQLKQLVKHYYVGNQTVEALKGVDLTFSDNEFVSILGPSGCGKTTMLNIIGGLDRYTSGDLLIDGKSTKEFKDTNWDAYRNSTIGFVFQNYNLISHLSVLDNVEMALSLSGVSAKERKERATKVLTEVGLADYLNNRPNQLSGGQMQRVAIARALVNNPKILLADEPTGALDSKTSAQIMDLIKVISKDRLVIMVTHNSKIAEKYSDRLIKLLDGEVLSDSQDKVLQSKDTSEMLVNKKTSMSYKQAIRTSFKNLFTKKGRTLITAIAGSIGIIGVALVLGISTGMNNYIDEMEQDTLSGFPITINQYALTDIGPGGPGGTFEDEDTHEEFPEEEIIYAYDEEASTTQHLNILDEDYVTYLDNMDENLYNSITYSRSMALNIVTENENGTYDLVIQESEFNLFGGSGSAFNEMPGDEDFVSSQYDTLHGTYPQNENEVALVISNKNEVDVTILEALGVNIESEYEYSDFVGKEFKVIPNDVFYQYNILFGTYLPSNDYESMYNDEESVTLTITGILRVNEDATSEVLNVGIGYLPTLTDSMLVDAKDSEVVMEQIANPETNILTGQAFNEQITYDVVMRLLGGDSTPSGIQIYPASYEAKEDIKAYLDAYNTDLTEEDQVIYTDISEVISSTISSLLGTITIILTAFAGISLVVSSIMIGIITYVSVVERTKEIGIMRSLGARKKDISRIFNAEALLIGLASGIIGIGVYYLLQFPMNSIISNLIDVQGFAALPITYAIGLIVLSSTLTLVAGLIPSRIASKKDPVIALRTE